MRGESEWAYCERVWKGAMHDAAEMCQAIANGYVSDVNSERSKERSEGAHLCASCILNPPKFYRLTS